MTQQIALAGFMAALVLATGLIVDDSIVVLENIQRRRNQGLAPFAAAPASFSTLRGLGVVIVSSLIAIARNVALSCPDCEGADCEAVIRKPPAGGPPGVSCNRFRAGGLVEHDLDAVFPEDIYKDYGRGENIRVSRSAAPVQDHTAHRALVCSTVDVVGSGGHC